MSRAAYGSMGMVKAGEVILETRQTWCMIGAITESLWTVQMFEGGLVLRGCFRGSNCKIC